MAIRIPIITENIQPQGLQTPRAQVSANGLGELGHGISQAGEVISRVQNEAANTRAQALLNELGSQDLDEQAKISQLEGAAAVNATEVFLKGRRERVAKLSAGLTGPIKERFEAGASRSELGFKSYALNHETREGQKLQETTRNAGYSLDAETAKRDAFNPVTVGLRKESLEARIADEIESRGFTGEQGKAAAEALRIQRTTPFHAAVIGERLKTNPEAAKAYFEEHQLQIGGKARDDMRELIDSGVRVATVNKSVDGVMATDLKYDEKAALLRDEFASDPVTQKEALRELHAREGERKVAEEETIGAIWDMKTGLKGGKPMSLSQIRQSPEWMNLSGTQRHALARSFEADDRRNEGKESDAEKLAKFATFMKLTDSPKLAEMSDEQIAGFTGVLGVDLTKKLLVDKREMLQDQAKLDQVKYDSAQFKDLAREYGLKVDGKLDEPEQARLGALRDATKDAIRAEQKGTKAPISEDRKEEIIRGLLKKVKTRQVDKWLWFDSTDEKASFEVQDFNTLDLQDPESAVIRARKTLESKGIRATPERIKAQIEELRRGGK